MGSHTQRVESYTLFPLPSVPYLSPIGVDLILVVCDRVESGGYMMILDTDSALSKPLGGVLISLIRGWVTQYPVRGAWPWLAQWCKRLLGVDRHSLDMHV